MTINNKLKQFGIVPSPIYDNYWRLATERQEIFFKRHLGLEAPWTEDEILKSYKFTNAYRASDRVSQFLIKEVIYGNDNKFPQNTLFRILLFKLFNKIETWKILENNFDGNITYHPGVFEKIDAILSYLLEDGVKIYSAAYIMPSGKSEFGHSKKHRNNLALLKMIMDSDLLYDLMSDKIRSLEELYNRLLEFPTLGKFLAFQFAIDINYSELCNFDENEFVVAGPGAIRGIKKCFSDIGKNKPEEVIKIITEIQHEEFERLGINFKNLWGRDLKQIDCQNLFCEFDKYSRVAFPEYSKLTGNSKIKQKYKNDNKEKIDYFFPPKWSDVIIV